MIRVGSLFSGVGGFEIGIEAAFGDSVKILWQVEKDPFCQKVLKKHWPNTLLIDDVKKVNKNTVPPIDMLIGGFPCQSISQAGNREGLENEEKSGLWWEMFRIIGDLKPRIVVLENVQNIIRIGGVEVVGSLAQIGYCCEWQIIQASDFGACHKRSRWFCAAYSNGLRRQAIKNIKMRFESKEKRKGTTNTSGDLCENVPDSNMSRNKTRPTPEKPMGKKRKTQDREHGWNRTLHSNEDQSRTSNWPGCTVEPILLGMDDGISDWMDRTTKREHNRRIKALGNAIVPACSEYVGRCILNSGLVDDLLEDDK